MGRVVHADCRGLSSAGAKRMPLFSCPHHQWEECGGMLFRCRTCQAHIARNVYRQARHMQSATPFLKCEFSCSIASVNSFFMPMRHTVIKARSGLRRGAVLFGRTMIRFLWRCNIEYNMIYPESCHDAELNHAQTCVRNRTWNSSDGCAQCM
ncbi:hypothetical protein BDW22DRAFT_1048908 [Trametopsis cervina]|nr:hypothetical protein BDW22DRAFT_1048908 [Trametopsis cervina]